MRRNRMAGLAAAVGVGASAIRNSKFLAGEAMKVYSKLRGGKSAPAKRKNFGPTGIHRERFIRNVALTTSVGGVLDTRFNLLNPTRVQNGTLTVEDWTEIAALYESYRIVAWKLHLLPELNSNDTTKVQKYITWGIDQNDPDTTAATSSATLLVNGGKMFQSHRPLHLKRKVRMPVTAINSAGAAIVQYRGGWCPIADMAVNGPTLKLYGASLTASTIYFSGYVEFFVEFKNRVHQP